MCLLVASIDGEALSYEVCANATIQNDDGFGVAYLSKDGKSVKIMKFRSLDPESQHLIIKRVAERGPYLAHWRYGTSGGKVRRLAHPFRISRRCALAHNGVMNIDNQPRDESDTSWLAKSLRNEGVRSARDVITTIMNLPSYIISGSKFATLDASGNIYIHNESAGIRKNNVWHSNYCGLNGTKYAGGKVTRSSGGHTSITYGGRGVATTTYEPYSGGYPHYHSDERLADHYAKLEEASSKNGTVVERSSTGVSGDDEIAEAEFDADANEALDQIEQEELSELARLEDTVIMD